MQTLFSFKDKTYAEVSTSCASLYRKEFYDGDLNSDSDGVGEMSFEKALHYPISLTHLTSKAQLSYQRSWAHIRNNRVGTRVVWFVRRGSLKIIRALGDCDVRAGEAAFLDTNAPFRATTQCDKDGSYESYQAIVPAQLFLSHLNGTEGFTDSFSLDSKKGKIVWRLVDILVSDGEHLSRQAAQGLVEGLLDTIAESTGCRDTGIHRRDRLTDRRLKDIEDYILLNLNDSDLCHDKVAAKCGISPRYLCYILKANNTSFTEFLWKHRLPKARDWLISPVTSDYPIHEIAFMTGFKSAAHFSRMFKSAYGCSPREYRAEHSSAAVATTMQNSVTLARQSAMTP